MEYAVVSFFASAWFFGWFKKNVEMNVCVIYASQIKIYCTYFRITFCIVDSTKETNLDVVFDCTVSVDCTTASAFLQGGEKILNMI